MQGLYAAKTSEGIFYVTRLPTPVRVRTSILTSGHITTLPSWNSLNLLKITWFSVFHWKFPDLRHSKIYPRAFFHFLISPLFIQLFQYGFLHNPKLRFRSSHHQLFLVLQQFYIHQNAIVQ